MWTGFLLCVSTFTYSIVGIFSTPIGNTILISGYFLQAQDAIYLANRYNADLYKNIYDKEPDKVPLKSIIQKLQWDLIVSWSKKHTEKTTTQNSHPSRSSRGMGA